MPPTNKAPTWMMVRNHENYKYFFIRPTTKQVVARYNKKFHTSLGTAGEAAGSEVAAAQPTAAVPPTTEV
jgi:hypothetical protein